MQHIQGANFNWDRNKDREAPQVRLGWGGMGDGWGVGGGEKGGL